MIAQMYSINQKLKVRDNHLYHPGRVGFFQFMGGPEKDAVVLSETPNTPHNYNVRNTFFTVKPQDIEE